MGTALQIKPIEEKLQAMLTEKANALPKNFNQTRFIQNCLVVLADTKEIELCTPQSIVRTMIKGAFLGLDFFNRECYAIVYNSNVGTKERPNWVKGLQFQTDYKGEMKLAKRYSTNKIKDIYSKLVREDDILEFKVEDGKQSVNFNPVVFSDKKIVGVFAVAYFVDGSMLCETMSIKEVEEVRNNYSKQPRGAAWTKSFGEMVRKVCLRRLCKLIDLDFDNAEQTQAWVDGSDADKAKLNTLDVPAREVEDPWAKNTKQLSEKSQQQKAIKSAAEKDATDKPPSQVEENADGSIKE